MGVIDEVVDGNAAFASGFEPAAADLHAAPYDRGPCSTADNAGIVVICQAPYPQFLSPHPCR